jgi:hypothetical protein
MLPLCKRNSSADTFPSYFCPTTGAGPRRRHRDPRPLWERACELRPNRRADERTRTAYPCSLLVIGQVLQGCAGACKSRISKPLSLLSVTRCCTVLRPRWYQSGIINTLSSTFDEGILSLGQSLLKRHPHIYPGCRSLASNRRAYYLRAYPCFPHSRG